VRCSEGAYWSGCKLQAGQAWLFVHWHVHSFKLIARNPEPETRNQTLDQKSNNVMAEKKPRKIEIVNRRAQYEYEFLDVLEAGLVLQGTEIKSIRKGNANLSDAYCVFQPDGLYVRSMFIAEYENGTYANHETRRIRKLLLRKPELRKLERRVKERGLTIVPYKLYLSDRGLAKLEIALAQGKKTHDKRESIKEKDNKRELDRMKKVTK
jgi:SsrA-binding protein